MTRKEYNGWTNYETWLVSLWIDNDEGIQSYFNEQAEEVVRVDCKEDAPSVLADIMKEFIEEQNPCTDNGLFCDLMSAALSEVDWFEIAEHYVSDVEIEEQQTA